MKTNKDIRVRFAPSPTGFLHIGGLRTALFNWLFAKHNNGTFLVRIEDTDIERSKPEFTRAILNTLSWVELIPDEPVLMQSSRLKEHQQLIEKLLNEGKAYKCYCSDDDLVKRNPTEAFLKYDGYCRDKNEQLNKPYAVRFKLPDQKELSFNDLIRGTVTFELDQFDDFIIQRSDGTPVYNFVVVVDDAFMKISQVIRGEDHISNTPKQILLYQALGFEVPQFAHLPLILGPSGDRLSKRDAATDVRDYRKKGYLPDALLNYLVRLGWSHGDQELFTNDELISFFTLEGVGKKGSVFDPQKLDWVNSVYIREMDDRDILAYLTDELDTKLLTQLEPWDEKNILYAIALFKERVVTLENLINDLVTLCKGPRTYNEDDLKLVNNEEAKKIIKNVMNILEKTDEWNEAHLTKVIKDLVKELGVKFVKLAQPIRIALLGRTSGPGVFSMIAIVGKKETLRRLQLLLDTLKA